ncbi:MAG TPA: hypothetical protein VF439_01030 [Candidatus Paceibacterota bacterium]
MKKKVALAALALSLFAGTTIAATPAFAAPRGARFWYADHASPVPVNVQLADAIRKSLAVDPTGMTLLDAVKCHTPHDRSCASAHDLLVRIRTNDPNASVDGVPLTDVSQLDEFFRKEVKLVKPDDGTYYMDCEMPDSSSRSGFAPRENCLQRPYYFKKGELAMVDRHTGATIGASDCANPVGRRVGRKPCGYIDYYSDDEDNDIVYGQWGTVDTLADQCTALLRAGETEYEAVDLMRCPEDLDCDLDSEGKLRGSAWWMGSHYLQKGKNRMRVSMDCVNDAEKCHIVFCKHLKDDTIELREIDVRAGDYLRVNGEMVATIYHDEVAARKSHTIIRGRPTKLWWHDAEDLRDEEVGDGN